MKGTLTVLSPVPDRPDEVQAATSARDLPDRIRLGVLSNGKPNTSPLLDGLLEVLTADSRFVLTERVRKQSASMPATADVRDRLAARADLVVTAAAD